MSVVVSKKVNESVPSSRWIASLSNGETIYEDYVDGMNSAWERLAEYVEQEDVSITNLRVQFESGRIVTLPAGQEGYIQKKKAWLTTGQGGVMLCIGYASKGKCLIHEASNDGDSVSIIGADPGEPWTIYKKEIRDAKRFREESIS
jgi:hypothetical protein